MPSNIARFLVVAAALLGTKGAPHAYLEDPPPQIPAAQKCDGSLKVYTAPGGSCTGTGLSAMRAYLNALGNAKHAVGLSVLPCRNCPDGEECPAGEPSCEFESLTMTSSMDSTTGIWTYQMSWDGCTLSQTCQPCAE